MSVTATTTHQFCWENRGVTPDVRAGVSIHSHTSCSEETLSVVPPALAKFIALRSGQGNQVNFAHGFWTPPLPPRQAYRLEEKQIHAQFDLPAIVSLTDHDNIRASCLLRVMRQFREAPISVEWSVPFGPTFFHLGVHNLNAQHADGIVRSLNAYTVRPEPARLRELLDALDEDPDVLVVANHPLWDEKGIGEAEHCSTLRRLLQLAGPTIHALEANGLRPLSEFHKVCAWAAERNLPVVAGGDRHGLEPNSILNLTRGTTLPEFIHEIRYERRSYLLFMPQFRQSRFLRILHMVTDVVRDYPDNFEGHRTFADRIFYRRPETQELVSFSAIYGKHSLSPVKHFLAAMQWVDRRPPSAILTNA